MSACCASNWDVCPTVRVAHLVIVWRVQWWAMESNNRALSHSHTHTHTNLVALFELWFTQLGSVTWSKNFHYFSHVCVCVALSLHKNWLADKRLPQVSLQKAVAVVESVWLNVQINSAMKLTQKSFGFSVRAQTWPSIVISLLTEAMTDTFACILTRTWVTHQDRVQHFFEKVPLACGNGSHFNFNTS